MLVKEVMTKSVKGVFVDTPMSNVVSMMCLYRISGLPVVDKDNQLIGFVAEKDVLHHLFPSLEDLMSNMATINYDELFDQYKDVFHLKVKDLMVNNVVAVAPDMHILKATSVMVKHKFRRIPVAEGNKLVGMLSIGDVHKAAFHQSLFGDDNLPACVRNA